MRSYLISCYINTIDKVLLYDKTLKKTIVMRHLQ